jgi:hypothetical protein
MPSSHRAGLSFTLGVAACSLLAGCGGDPVLTEACPTPAAVTGPAALRLTIQSLTTGTPPQPVDPAAVRGTVTLTANVGAELVPAAGSRLELRAAGRLVAAAVARPAGEYVSVPLTVATDARDAGGARLVPNGPQQWAVSLFIGAAPRAGCSPAHVVTIVQELSVTNP